jgi:hypothetical protein
MFCRPIILCVLNCVTENIQVTDGLMLASPALDVDVNLPIYVISIIM